MYLGTIEFKPGGNNQLPVTVKKSIKLTHNFTDLPQYNIRKNI